MPRLFPLLLLVANLAASAQTPNQPVSAPHSPREFLNAAAPHYDFDNAALRPWHMKATYQFFDLKGKPETEGTWEYWWSSPKVHRSSWTRKDMTRSEWSTADGAIYRKDSGQSLRYFERAIPATVLNPLPTPAALDSEKTQLDLKMLPAGSVSLVCVLSTDKVEKDGKLQVPSFARSNYYCLDPSTLALRMTYSESLTTEYNRIVKTQDRFLARQIAVSAGKQSVFNVSVDVIEGLNPDTPDLTKPDDAVLLLPANIRQDASAPVTAVMQGALLKKVPPEYPMVAKMDGEQGTVILSATIGTDGKIRDLEVLVSPSPL